MVPTDPNELVRTYHDRTPVILAEDAAEAWLTDPDITSMCGGLLPEALALETLPPRLKITRPAQTPTDLLL
jgi:putative SOS response-associated peptidase YedK